MMVTQKLIFLTCSSLLILSVHCIPQACTPSSCGLIPNISYPFRLKNDPHNCGEPDAELGCENDVATIHLAQDSQRYYVREINYHDFTIRLSHIHPNNINISSICKYFSSSANWEPLWDHHLPFKIDINSRINFISCANPLQNSSLLTRVAGCEEGTHAYLKLGALNPTDVEHMCTLEAILATAWTFTDFSDNISLSEIHESLYYGFNLSWSSFVCETGHVRSDGLGCEEYDPFRLRRKWARAMESFLPPDGSTAGYLIFMLVAAVVFAGVSIPAKIVIGFGASYWVLLKKWSRSDIQRIIDVSFEVRFGVGFLCAMGFLIHKFRRRRMSEYEEIEGFLQSDNKLTPIRYSYSDLKKMTRGFREKLGQGGFGSVYKGKLRSGHHVAVKLLGKGTTEGQDFINEIGTIGRIHHVNVVQLLGYCAERSKRALVFDFMSNGSLEKYIFNREKTCILDWDTKFKIAVGVARGIEYLHRGCDVRILHFDIKPHNILLDDKFVPKVSDFGLAKLCPLEKDTVTMTAARGTVGYVAPELINRSIGAVSYKADVYSFGMLLIEMAGLNRELRGSSDDSTKYFPHWIYESFNQGKDIIGIEKAKEDGGGEENESTKSLIRKMAIVALWCIQMNPDDRPSMNKVLQMLEDDHERLHIPEYPSESAHMTVVEEESWTTASIHSAPLVPFNKSTSIDVTIA